MIIVVGVKTCIQYTMYSSSVYTVLVYFYAIVSSSVKNCVVTHAPTVLGVRVCVCVCVCVCVLCVTATLGSWLEWASLKLHRHPSMCV